ncbi:MAG: hypothetical protein F6K40_17725 [Okeania sp. SIO3I5]|uniref:hypothetical protein n=1 Tax=Okeania sp. SIO3I5 TaxID=2607805 RepID=UPI0013BD199B|nr:hypothetical protein [Okeania sp. SIO3I5]NEQ38004.1 hypothetical protein [Okeania sp. SIO3I5]
MSKKKPELDIDNYSVAKLVTELHEYFQNSQAYYEVIQGETRKQIGASDNIEKEREVTEEMKLLAQKISFFGALNDVLSAADRLVHAQGIVSDMGLNEDLYGKQ